ncbi:hypothetical protein EOD39_9831 [Acipenser ruthenus]|uniref:HAT C-terminal dimerisation domain-containing protein n=1 Tax=Acipenser ruthenus TaxID=7906 RepID=A0A444TZS5_ACIRT|nr:hypothetical protein EOD39_9831 [Acipenser ruthenus]
MWSNDIGGTVQSVHEDLLYSVPSLIIPVSRRVQTHDSLILAVSRAYEQSLPKFLDFIVKETYNWFSQSAGRQITYKKLFAAINDGEEPQKILRACATRWISVEPAVRRILQQWLELKTLFAVARENERCYMADQLYRLYCDPQSRAFLIFVKNVLSQVQAVNKTFQGNNVDPTKLIDGLIRLVTSLGCSVTLPTAQVDYLKGDIRQHLDPRPQLGYEAEKAIREDAVPEAAKAGIRGRCVDFTVKLLEEIRNRLPDNIEILRQMSALSVGEALRHTKKPITELAEMFMTSPEEINQIEIQWRNIHHIQWEHVDNTEKFWCEVESYRDATGDKPFKELCNLALTILTLPHSNAQVERVFSQLNVVKTKLRNRLSLLTVNSILHIRYGLQTAGKKCYQYSLPSSMLRITGTMESYSSKSKQANPEEEEPPLDEDVIQALL